MGFGICRGSVTMGWAWFNNYSHKLEFLLDWPVCLHYPRSLSRLPNGHKPTPFHTELQKPTSPASPPNRYTANFILILEPNIHLKSNNHTTNLNLTQFLQKKAGLWSPLVLFPLTHLISTKFSLSQLLKTWTWRTSNSLDLIFNIAIQKCKSELPNLSQNWFPLKISSCII